MVLFLFACSAPVDPDAIQGQWKVDSVFRYYNGFEQHIPGKKTDPTYHYLEGNKVREQKGRDYREYIYAWKDPDTLSYQAPDGEMIGIYQVLHLSSHQMALKRQQPHIFAGGGQERYEIRYFSKTSEE